MLTNRPARRTSSASSTVLVGLALVVVTMLSGCYTYAPVIGEDPSPSEDIRVRLSASAATDLSARVGQPIRSVEGSLLNVTPDSLSLNVSWGAIYAGTVFEGRTEALSFHRDQILEVDRKEFSRLRTGLLGAAVGVAVAVIFRTISGRGDPDDSGGPRDPEF